MKKFILIATLLTVFSTAFADNRSDSEVLFDWAESNFPEHFSPPNKSTSIIDDYLVRHYSKTDIYLGTLGDDVYVYGQIFGGLLNVGKIGDFIQTNVELTENNPSSLLNTTSNDYTVYGLKLGMTHDEAWSILNNSKYLVGEKDSYNPTRIYVNDNNREELLYLIWLPGETELSKIVVYSGFQDHLTDNFKRLLTFEALDNNSSFKRSFIGYADSSEVTLDVPVISLKQTDYYYKNIGLVINYYQSSTGNQVYFSLIKVGS